MSAVQVIGAKEVIASFIKAGITAEVRGRVAEQRAAQKLYDIMLPLIPVDEGDLRDSAYVDGSEVGTTAEHGPYVEYGTAYMDPQPFANPAADETEEVFVQLVGGIGTMDDAD